MARDPLLLFKISQSISYLAEYYLAAGFAGLKWPTTETGGPGIDVLCGYYFPQPFQNKGRPTSNNRLPLDQDTAAYLMDVSLTPENVGPPPADFPFANTIDMPATVLLDYCSLGFINVPRDRDGIIRRLPLVWGVVLPTENGPEKRVLPSFALLAYLQYCNVSTDNVVVKFGKAVSIQSPSGKCLLEIPVDDYGRMFLNFDCRLSDMPSVSLIDVLTLNGNKNKNTPQNSRRHRLKSMIDDRLCLVGLVAPGTTDIGPTPIDPNTPFVQVHLTALKNMITKQIIRPVKRGERIGILALVGLLFVFVAYLPRISTFLWGALGVFMAYLALCYALVHWHIVMLPVVTPMVQMALAFVSILFVRYWTEERAKRRIRSMFSTMVSVDVLRYMEEHPESFALKGNRVHATVMFSDINHFTTLAEKLDPDDLAELLNQYFSTMTEVIMESDGYVDKFEGDAIMAEWGVPYPDSKHAITACRAVLAQREVLARLNPKIQARFGVEFSVRFGICSGELSAGNMGSQKKFQYTVMGNVVNQAARLEPLNKIYGTSILVGESTRRLADADFQFRHIDRVVLAGMTDPMDIYELITENANTSQTHMNSMLQYEEGLRLYQKKQWNDADNVFRLVIEELGDDPPSQTMLKRIQRFRDTPPPEDWGGVFEFTTKQ